MSESDLPDDHALAFNDDESLWMRVVIVMELILFGLVMGFFGLIIWILKKTTGETTQDGVSE